MFSAIPSMVGVRPLLVRGFQFWDAFGLPVALGFSGESGNLQPGFHSVLGKSCSLSFLMWPLSQPSTSSLNTAVCPNWGYS